MDTIGTVAGRKEAEFAALRTAVRAAGSDNLGHFGNGYIREGGYSLQQNPDEFAAAVLVLAELLGPEASYLEIGAASGGTCRFLHEYLNFSKVGVIDDRSHPRWGEQIEHFEAMSVKPKVFVGDSHGSEVVDFVEKFGRSDLAFIDGDHSHAGCRQDFLLVRPFARYVIFHDIVACEGVRTVWQEAIDARWIEPVASLVGEERPLGIGIGRVIHNVVNDLSSSTCRNPKLTMIVTVKDEAVFARDLLPSIQDNLDEIEVIVVRNAKSQASALNLGIEQASADLIVCPHADVAFPAGWFSRLQQLLVACPEPWGVVGMAGAAMGGKMWGTHSGLGMGGYEHVGVQTLDGSCLVLRKSSGLRFDELFDRFHMYDADICLQAGEKGLGVYAVGLGIEHRSKWTAGGGFIEAVHKLQKKWKRKVQNIYTTVGTH